jgi:hypothetical protein
MATIYETLNAEQNQIRTLSLEPGNFDDAITGTLGVLCLGDHPKYEALSYVWGMDVALKPMVLENISMPITQNLDIALRHLRSAVKSRTLWVDAVCIDQSNPKERAQQVRLMDRIYKSASTVLVWLGPSEKNSDLVMRRIQFFHKKYWLTYEFQVGLMEILYRPWFTRIWVIQEFLLGKTPRIGCGDVWVPWVSFFYAWADAGLEAKAIDQEYKKEIREAVIASFKPSWHPQHAPDATIPDLVFRNTLLSGLQTAFEENFLQHLGFKDESDLSSDIKINTVLWKERYAAIRYHQHESPVAKAYFRKWELTQTIPIQYHNFLWHSRGTLQNRKSLSIVSILKGTMNLRSTDPRDKIYGILGLVSEKARKAILVDYEKAPEWTFVPTMEYLIKSESDGLALLSLIWRTRMFTNSFPSWCADFTISADTSDVHSPVLLKGSCVNAAWNWTQDAEVLPDHSTLTTSGICFGKVARLFTFAGDDMKSYVKLFQEIESIVTRECPLSEPLWRTLIGVHNTTEVPSDPDEPLSQSFRLLMTLPDNNTEVRMSDSVALAFKMFRDMILPIVRGRAFFITDMGFAGISTAGIKEGDTIGILFGMVRPAVLRPVVPSELGVKTGVSDEGIIFHRIVAFSYIGCHDRKEFSQLERGELPGWNEHFCFRNKHVVKFYII